MVNFCINIMKSLELRNHEYPIDVTVRFIHRNMNRCVIKLTLASIMVTQKSQKKLNKGRLMM